MGEDVNECISVLNHIDKVVCGITPLFLAAQRGRTKVCKLLIENGANPNQPSYIENSTELCTPAQVASLNLHFILARYLKKAVKKRREENVVLDDDEHVSRRLSRVVSISSAAPEGSTPATEFMANIGDLTNWNPESGGKVDKKQGQAKLDPESGGKVDKKQGQAKWDPESGEKVDKKQGQAKLDPESGGKVDKKQGSKLMSTLNLFKWRPDSRNDLFSTSSVSRSQPVDPNQLDNEDNTKVLNKFLKVLDLSEWDPSGAGGAEEANSGPDGSPSYLPSYHLNYPPVPTFPLPLRVQFLKELDLSEWDPSGAEAAEEVDSGPDGSPSCPSPGTPKTPQALDNGRSPFSLVTQPFGAP
eukprot:gene26757-4335_t